jgi:hypothetical protein
MKSKKTLLPLLLLAVFLAFSWPGANVGAAGANSSRTRYAGDASYRTVQYYYYGYPYGYYRPYYYNPGFYVNTPFFGFSFGF